MSWNIDVIGTKAGVAASVQAASYLPDEIKSLVLKIAGAKTSMNGLRVKTSGHVDAGLGGNVYELAIEPVNIEVAAGELVPLSDLTIAPAQNGPVFSTRSQPA